MGPMVMATRPTSHGSRKMYAALLSRPLAFFSSAVALPLRRVMELSSLMALIAVTPSRVIRTAAAGIPAGRGVLGMCLAAMWSPLVIVASTSGGNRRGR